MDIAKGVFTMPKLVILFVAIIGSTVGTDFTCRLNSDTVDFGSGESYVEDQLAQVSAKLHSLQIKINSLESRFASQKSSGYARLGQLTSRIATLETRRQREKDCYVGDGRDYRGSVSRTNTGITCQYWTSQSPHDHTRTPNRYRNRGLGSHNFCRNPDGEDAPWCYTKDSGRRWEYCPVSQC